MSLCGLGYLMRKVTCFLLNPFYRELQSTISPHLHFLRSLKINKEESSNAGVMKVGLKKKKMEKMENTYQANNRFRTVLHLL
jgi:hypothetical protein